MTGLAAGWTLAFPRLAGLMVAGLMVAGLMVAGLRSTPAASVYALFQAPYFAEMPIEFL